MKRDKFQTIGADDAVADMSSLSGTVVTRASVTERFLSLFAGSARARYTEQVARLVEIDLRSLALFRIALAGAILLDLASRVGDLTAHYTNLGVLPRDVLTVGLRPSIGGFIATHWPGGWYAAALLMGIYAVGAVMLLVGYRTRSATVLCWLCQLTLLARNPLVLHRADTLVKMLLFWSIFLPLAARFSVDARADKPRSRTVVSPAGAALLLQPCLMFWFAVLSRNPFEWWVEGSALYYASHCDVIVRPLGARLRELSPGMSTLMTRAVVLSEAILPLTLWIPWATAGIRIASLVLLILMPLAFGMAFNIGLFPLVCAVSVLPFLPGRVWERDAPKPGSIGRPLRTGWTVAALLVFVLALNLDTHTRFKLPQSLRAAGVFLGLNQRWDIFAPAPPRQDEWFVVLGRQHDGTVIDLLRDGAPPSWDKPASFRKYWGNYRWRRYWFNMLGFPTLHARYANYAAHEWDRSHVGLERLDAVRVELVRERTPRFGTIESAAPLERERVWPPSGAPAPASTEK